MRRYPRGSRYLKVAAAAVFSMALISATACSTGDTDEQTVSVAGGDQIGAAQFLVAEAEGLWKEEDIDAERQSYPSGRDALNALLGGQADVATIGDLPTVTAILGEQDLRVVSTLSWGTQWRLLTTTDSGVGDFPDLRGKRIGLTEGTNTQYLLSRILDDAGLSAADITLVNLTASQVPVALNAGDIDAGLTFPTFYATTQELLGDRLVELTYEDYESPTMLVTRSDVPDERIEAVLSVLHRAQEVIDGDESAAQAAVVTGSAGSLNADSAAALWPLYRIGLSLDEALISALTAEAEWASTTLELNSPAGPEAIRGAIHPEPLRAVDPDAVTID